MHLSGLIVTLLAWSLGTGTPALEDDGLGTEASLGPTIDFAAFVDCFDGPNNPIAAGCSTSNFHPDTHIDMADFAVIQRGYLLTPGTIQFAAETAGEIAPLDDVDEYTFAGVFGSTATVDFVTPSVSNRPDLVVRLDLIRPAGSTAATTASCGTTARLDTIPVDATGTWKVRVRAYESWANCGYGADAALRTGLYTLALCPSDTPPIPIAYGETLTNVFASDCHIINYEFTGAADDVVSAIYMGPALTRRVRLYAPNGALLATSGSGAGTAITDVALPLDGTYRIAVEAADGQPTGSFSIGLSELGSATPIVLDTVTAGSIDRPAAADAYTFHAAFGATVTVDFATPSVNGRPDIVSRIDLVRPNGTTASSTATCSTTARLDTIPVDFTGTWTVRVRAYESWFNCGYGADIGLISGSYSLIVTSSDTPPVLIAYGQTKSGTLVVDGQIINFQFNGTTGDVASVMYLGPAYTRRVRLFAPNGTLLATSGGGQGTALTDISLPLTGLYHIAVEAGDNQPLGNFSIGLSKLGLATPILMATATPGSLSSTAEADGYSFTGTFGSTVTVDFSTSSVNSRPDLVVRLDLIRPAGTVAASTASCGTDARLDTVTLDATGTWTVRVRAYESWFNCGYGLDTNLLTGDYTLAVCTSDAPATTISYGQVRDGSLRVDCEIVNYQFTGAAGDIATILYFGPAYVRRVQLFAPNGVLLATSGSGQGTSLNDVVLPASGVYRIAVEAADNRAVGDFSIALNRLGTATPIALDTSIPGSLAQIAESDAYSFNGLFGSTVTVDFSTPVLGNQPDIVSRLDLVRPDGTLASTTAACGGNARLDNVLIDDTGSWTIRLRAFEGWFNCGFGVDTALLTGNYTIAASTSNSPATAIAYGQTRDGNLVVDSQIVNFQFGGLLGDAATAVYYGPAYARRIQMFAPNGALLATSGGGLGAAVLDVPLPLNGTYRLAVEAADNQATGVFSVGLSELSDAVAIAFGTATAGAIDQIADVRLYEFNRSSGDVVTVDYVTAVNAGRPDLVVRLDLVRPDGTLASSTASCGGTARLNNITIDQTGLWTARVRAYEGWANCGFGQDAGLLTGGFTIRVCLGNCP